MAFFCLLAGLRRSYSTDFHEINFVERRPAHEPRNKSSFLITLRYRVGVTLSWFGLRLSRDQSHPCHCKNSVGLWLHGYKFDLGEGLTQLTGTVVTWRMYALY